MIHIIDIEKLFGIGIHFKCSHLLSRCVLHFMFSTYYNNFLLTLFYWVNLIPSKCMLVYF